MKECPYEQIEGEPTLDLTGLPARAQTVIGFLIPGCEARPTLRQVAWLCSDVTPEELRGFAKVIYQAIADTGQKALIPWDIQQKFLTPE